MKIVKPGIILAADFGNTSEAIEVLENLKSDLLYVKIGPGLFASGGMGFVREVIESGFRVFLDLKLHDIPNTVSSAVDFFSRSGIWALTLHAAGGSGMLEAASRTNALAGGEMMLLGVTVLTSLDGEEWKKVCPGCIMTEALESRACLCKKSGWTELYAPLPILLFLFQVSGTTWSWWSRGSVTAFRKMTRNGRPPSRRPLITEQTMWLWEGRS